MEMLQSKDAIKERTIMKKHALKYVQEDRIRTRMKNGVG